MVQICWIDGVAVATMLDWETRIALRNDDMIILDIQELLRQVWSAADSCPHTEGTKQHSPMPAEPARIVGQIHAHLALFNIKSRQSPAQRALTTTARIKEGQAP